MKILLTLLFTAIVMLSFSQDEGCLYFDGYNDYVIVGDVNDLGTSDFTIEAWIYVESTSYPANKIVNKGLTSAGTPVNAGYALRANYHDSDEVEFHLGHSDGSTKRLLYPGVSINEWHHLAGVRMGTKLELYLDGELVLTGTTHVVYDVSTNIQLCIGAIYKNGIQPVNEHMHGKIDEVRIWDDARSPYEIEDYMNCAITEPMPNLLAVYNFNELSGLTAMDSSGNGNDGGLMYGPIWNTSEVALSCVVSAEEVVEEVIEDPFTNPMVYPNPFTSYLNVHESLFERPFSIYDLTGKKIHSGICCTRIDLSHLIPGYYIIEIFGEKKLYREKIVKQ